MSFVKTVIKDVFYISKLTKTKRKKLLISLSIFFGQMSVMSDLILIGFFTFKIANQQSGIKIIDSITNFLDLYPVFILIVIVLRFTVLFYQSYILRKIENDVSKNLKEIILEEIFERRTFTVSDSYFYINELSGHLGYFYSNFAGFVNSLFQVIVFAAYLISSNYFVLLLLALGVLLMFFPIKKIISISRNYVDKSYHAMNQSMHEIERVVDNLFLIKIMKTESLEISKFSITLGKLNSYLLNTHSFNLINGFLPSFLTLLIVGILVGFFSSVINLTLDFIGVTLKLFNSFSGLTKATTNILNSHVHLSKFREIDFNSKILEKKNYIKSHNDLIHLNNVKFKYLNSSEYIFSNLTATFKANEHTIVTGDNGTGKSTLLGLISGIYYPTSGTVSTFSEKFAYVSAQPYIFNDTLRNNLIYGSEILNIDDKTLEILLKEFKTFKNDNDFDLNRYISNKKLSSGQMQKIGFIRAIISNPEIIILDESTSNLDFDSKQIVFNKLKQNKVTIINSTHDPENFEFADVHFQINIKDGNRELIKKEIN